MSAIRSAWHQLTHRHTEASKPEVGVILLCTHRFTKRVRFAEVFVGRAHWRLRNPTVEHLADLAAAPTAVELALTAWEIEVSVR